MGFFSWLGDRMERYANKPADPSVLLGDRNRGSEAMVEADSPEEEQAIAAGVRGDRNRRRWRWLRF